MKAGTLVKKSSGDYDVGVIGVILDATVNAVDNLILTVLADGDKKSWYGKHVEVIDEVNEQR
jgi:hypothetical protein